MSFLRRLICERLCGHAPRPGDGVKELLPTELRRYSHGLANRAAEIDGLSEKIKRDIDALARMARVAQRMREERAP